MGGGIYLKNKKQTKIANEKLQETTSEIAKMENELSQIQSYTNAYISLIESAENKDVSNSKNARVISKNALPNMLNKIMFIIPQKVQLISIENTQSNHIVIVAVAEQYEQLAYFVAAIKSDGMFENIQSTTGTKSDSLIQITIEGDLK